MFPLPNEFVKLCNFILNAWWWNWPETKQEHEWEACLSFFRLMAHRRRSRWSRSKAHKWDWKLFWKSSTVVTTFGKSVLKEKLNFSTRWKNHFCAVLKMKAFIALSGQARLIISLKKTQISECKWRNEQVNCLNQGTTNSSHQPKAAAPAIAQHLLKSNKASHS